MESILTLYSAISVHKLIPVLMPASEWSSRVFHQHLTNAFYAIVVHVSFVKFYFVSTNMLIESFSVTRMLLHMKASVVSVYCQGVPVQFLKIDIKVSFFNATALGEHSDITASSPTQTNRYDQPFQHNRNMTAESNLDF